MPEAVLQGADGQPAIDAATGTSLTMEELLRRRGIIYSQGMQRLVPDTATNSAVSGKESSALATAAIARNKGQLGSPAAKKFGASNKASPKPGQPAGQASKTANSNDPSSDVDLMPYAKAAVVGGATAAGYALMKRRAKNGAPVPAGATSANVPAVASTTNANALGTVLDGVTVDPNAPRLGNAPIDAEFTEVPVLKNLQRALTDRRTQKLLTRAIR